MTSLTIRNVDEATKQKLRMRAARDGVSMEEEVRRILKEALRPAEAPSDLPRRAIVSPVADESSCPSGMRRPAPLG